MTAVLTTGPGWLDLSVIVLAGIGFIYVFEEIAKSREEGKRKRAAGSPTRTADTLRERIRLHQQRIAETQAVIDDVNARGGHIPPDDQRAYDGTFDHHREQIARLEQRLAKLDPNA